MEARHIALSFAMILAIIYTTLADEATDIVSDNELQAINHQPQKRSAMLAPDDDVIYGTDEMFGLPSYALETEPEKRGSLLRFGKRGGSMLRYGKRGGALFRFGKRGSLFRFGKRNGSLLRFGRSGPIDDDVEEKRTLFRFGKRSDADRLREILSQYQDLEPAYEDIAEKRSDSFHWGKQGDK